MKAWFTWISRRKSSSGKATAITNRWIRGRDRRDLCGRSDVSETGERAQSHRCRRNQAAHYEIRNPKSSYNGEVIRYQDAGVSIDEADRAVSSVKKLARATFTRNVLTDIGSFGACYALSGWKKPVLISSADGVGTKLKVAFRTSRHDTVGEDRANHCVNDIAVQGAVPLFFLDYFAVGKLDAGVAATVFSGMAHGCRNNGCALIGGETAEMPGMYADGEYDLAGFIVGAAERERLLDGRKIAAGDLLLALPSSGLHTNGYSL